MMKTLLANNSVQLILWPGMPASTSTIMILVIGSPVSSARIVLVQPHIRTLNIEISIYCQLPGHLQIQVWELALISRAQGVKMCQACEHRALGQLLWLA